MNKVESTGNALGSWAGKPAMAGGAGGKSFAATLQDAQEADAGRHKLGLANQGPSDAEQELQDYLTMSPAERLFTQILQSLGITKEQYAAMTPAQKEEVARKVQERIKELAKQEQGAAGPV